MISGVDATLQSITAVVTSSPQAAAFVLYYTLPAYSSSKIFMIYLYRKNFPFHCESDVFLHENVILFRSLTDFLSRAMYGLSVRGNRTSRRRRKVYYVIHRRRRRRHGLPLLRTRSSLVPACSYSTLKSIKYKTAELFYCMIITRILVLRSFFGGKKRYIFH